MSASASGYEERGERRHARPGHAHSGQDRSSHDRPGSGSGRPPATRQPVPVGLGENSRARHGEHGQDRALRPGRPDAAFLAQYLDQHLAWPGRGEQTSKQRLKAVNAYEEAENLPALLIETLRLKLNRTL